ncbi:MAG: hypothetical protein QM535_17820 [Limnohabitans sp.]|nr:hypothetical protein [Limnohabitans sp.]
MKIFKLLVFTSILFFISCNQSNSLDEFIKQNTKVSQKTQKYFVGQFPECNLSDVYFVEGFDNKNILKERVIVFKQNGVYSVNNKFLFWGAQKYPVLYYHNSDSLENKTDLVNLKITFSNNKFTFSNIDLQKTNTVIQKKVENGTNTEEDISETGGSNDYNFKEFLEDTNCGK